MTLDEYLKSGRKTAETIAAEIGISEASVSRIRNKLQKPSFDTIRAIIEATDGAVPADALLWRTPAVVQADAA